MRFWIRRSASVLAILGGVLFLILPVAFFNGIVAVAYRQLSPCDTGFCHGITLFREPLGETASFWAALGLVGILLGVSILRLRIKRDRGVPMGLAFSLGSMALLFGIATLDIIETFITTPAGFLLFPETSTVAMAGATVMFSYELTHRGREVIDATTS